MSEKKYLIYLDILGFGGLAKEIAIKKGVDQRKVRGDFIDTIKEKVNILETEGKIIGQNYGGKDDWILVTDSFDNIFYCGYEILDHNTGYKNYEKIPIEFAVGTGEYDRWVRFDGSNLILEDDTIKFLKSYIINHYHEWYKERHGQSPKSTFIILTESAYDDLEPLDKRMCQEIEHRIKRDGKEEVIIFFLADIGKFQRRGKVIKFLEEIELPGHRFYKRIEEAYVPPLEYDDIVNTLKEKRIVFITGTQEYGKTFTAVRLMWEYYNYGYKPSWIKGGELPERIEVRKRLENIRAELKPKHIIYYEDPFGKIRYERRETLEREIGTILDSVRQVEDVYVIITSREEVFKEFEKDKLSAKELKDFERRLNIKRPSYDYENRKRILLNWAEESNCRWLKDEKLKGLVLEEMKDKSILPTPLSIRDFAVASFDIEKEDELKEKLREKSKETAKAFAEEIRNMTDDKILFLSFIFIIDEFEVEFVRRMYQELVKELNLKDAWEFDRVLEWFKDDKIDIEHGGFSKIEFIEFSHPSYAEALEYILIENGYLTRISKDIFSKVLLKLSKIEKNEYEYAGYFIREVARTVAWHFSGLPEDVRNQLLLELSEKKEAARGVALAIAGNFNKLPESVRYLLFKLSERNAGDVAWAIVRYFNELPEDVRNLLFKLSEKVGAVYDIAEAIIINFYKLPENVRNLLFKLSRKKIVVDVIARAVAENFKYLPEDVRNQLLLKLSKKDEAVKEVARVVAENFTDIPKDMRNQLLLELSKKDKAMKNIARAIAENFNELPEDVRNQLLLELSEREIAKLKSESMGSIVRFLIFQFPLRVDDTVAGYIARAIIENFNELPEDVRNQLFKLSEVSEYEVTRYLAELIAENFNKPPEDIARNLLFKLSKINEGGVAWAIAANFNNLPEDVRNLLFKLSGGRYYVWDIALAVKAYFDELPEDVRNQLLLKLSKKNEAAEYVTWTVIHNFDKLSKDVIENLLKIKRIQKALEKIISEWKKY